MADALREKHRRSRGATPEREPESAPEREPEPAPSPAPEREHARKDERRGTPEAPEGPTEGRTEVSEPSGPMDVPQGPTDDPEGVAGTEDAAIAVLWELDQATRSYLGGLKKIAPRTKRLAAAVAEYLDAGGSPADIRSRFAAIGIPAKDIPPEIQEALRRR